MKTITLFSIIFFCMTLTHTIMAKTDFSSDEKIEAGGTKNQSGFDYCDHWPESCYETCENGSSPWGPYQICRLTPPWDPIADSDNAYNYVGQAHNKALSKIGAVSSFKNADNKLRTTHMIQLTAEYLCEYGVPENQNEFVVPNERISANAFVNSDEFCTFRYAGLANEVINNLRDIIYSDDKVDGLADAYLKAFKINNTLTSEQFEAVENLYRLLPDEDNIDDLPKLFNRINEFDRYVSRQMREEDAEVVLLTSSVMSASLEYWLGEIDESSDWFAIEPGNTERRGIFRKILKLIAADAGGCLGGSIIMGIPGCVIGGVGASAGAGAAMN